jgi:hypothetical protein
MVHFKKVFEAFNFQLGDNIELLLENSDELRLKLKGIDINKFKALKNQAKFIVFIVTKSYYESELFERQWKEANDFKNKEIVIIMNEEEDFDTANMFMNRKIFKLSFTHSSKEKKIFEDFMKYQKKSLPVGYNY